MKSINEDPGGRGRRRCWPPPPALADVNIGVSCSLTGPASGLGIPMDNQFKLWPQTIAGEKVNLIILDDATDPGKGVQNARRFVTDDKVDMIIGSARSPPVVGRDRAGGRRGQDGADLDRAGGRAARAGALGRSACRRASRVMALPDRRAHEEGRRQDRRLPRLHRRLRRAVAEGVHGRRPRRPASRSSPPSASRAPTPASRRRR